MKQFSIRQYVAWLTLIPLLIMAVSLESFFLHDRFSDLDNDLTDRGKLIARQLASSSEYGVFSNNQSFLQSIAQGVLQQPDVRGVIILNAASNALIATGEFSGAEVSAGTAKFEQSSQAGLILANKSKEMVNQQTPVFSDGQSLWIYHPIISVQVALDNIGIKPPDQQVGAVIIEMSWARTVKLKSQMFWITIGATGWFLIFSFYLVAIASRRITTPICMLSDAIRAIGNGRLETRVSVSSRVTELETLVNGINDMAEKLQQENAIVHQRLEDAIRIAAIAFESHEGMMIADPACMIMRVNKAFTRITGYSEAEALGQTPRLLRSGHHDDIFFTAMWESINTKGLWQGEIWNRRKNGEVYPAWVNITAVEREVGEVVYYVATYTDITLRKAAENEIKILAFNDPLTQLPNRRMLIERLNLSMAVSKRSGRYGALLFIDLDNFKPLNDQYGHDKGDLLLVEVASRLISCVREVDTVGRFGGDEFVVILSELDANKAESISQTRIVAEKVRAILAEPYTLTIPKNGQMITAVAHQCTSSIGVQLFFGQDSSADDVLKQGDFAMYQAKRNGGNAFRFFE